MAKVIQAFRERHQGFKLFSVGDEYPEADKERVEYLVKLGFLEAPGFISGGIVSAGVLGVVGENKEEVIPISKIEKVNKPKRGKKGADADGDSDA